MPTREIIDIIFSIFKDNPLKVISRVKALLGVIFLVGLSLLLYQSLLAQQLVKLKPIERSFLSHKRLLSCQEKIIAEPQLLLSKIAQMKSKLENIEGRFIPEQKLAQLFEDLKILVNKTENQLISLDIKQSVPLGRYHKLPFGLSVSGYYVDIILLLNKLEGYPRLVNVKDIKMQVTEEGYRNVLVNLDAEVFVIKD